MPHTRRRQSGFPGEPSLPPKTRDPLMVTYKWYPGRDILGLYDSYRATGRKLPSHKKAPLEDSRIDPFLRTYNWKMFNPSAQAPRCIIQYRQIFFSNEKSTPDQSRD